MATAFFRTVILYLLLIAGLRITGKRQIGELEPIELVLTMLLSDLASVPMQDFGIPLVNGIVPIVTLLSLSMLLSYGSLRSVRFRTLLCGEPTLIIRSGHILQDAMRRNRLTVDELLDPKAPVRTLEKSDWQNLLSFAFAIGGGLLFYLLAQFVPLPLCWALYLGCLAYGIYLQAHYTYHARWFRLGSWAMCFCVSWTLAEELGGVVFQVLFPTVLSQWKNMIFQLLRGDAGALLQLVLVLGPLWLAGACGLTVLTQLAARRLAGERGDLPVRLPDLRGHPRLARAPFAWSKAMPALCPIVLAGFWYLYRQTLLPRFWYQHQQELYLAVWTMAGVLALLPCLKRRHWGMLLPVLAMMLACLGFRGMLAYPQVYSLFSGRLMEEKAEMSTQYYLRFGQPSEELAVAALLVAAVYLLCCFLRVEWVPAEQKGRQEPEES